MNLNTQPIYATEQLNGKEIQFPIGVERFCNKKANISA
jgi:hypothetical protein